MTYVMADIHGDYASYRQMLKEIDFKDEDTIYIIGDLCDRGEYSAELFLDVMDRKNIICLKGNHELMAESVIPSLFNAAENMSDGNINLKVTPELALWFENGGDKTIESLIRCKQEDRQKILDFIENMPYYGEVKTEKGEFLLVHSGLGNFSPERPIEDYSPRELAWCRPDLNAKLWDEEDKYLIVGHTPVLIMRPQPHPRIYKGKGNIIDIDCGNAYREQGGWLACVCLDTMQEYYV